MEFIQDNKNFIPPTGTYIQVDNSPGCLVTNKVTAGVKSPNIYQGVNATGGKSFVPSTFTLLDVYGLPVPSANVFLKNNPSVGAITDANGVVDVSQFGFNDEIVISHISYDTLNTTRGGLNNNLVLTPSINSLDEVVISSSSNDPPVQVKKPIPWYLIAGGVLLGTVLINSGTKKKKTPSLKGAISKKKKAKKKYSKSKKRRIHV